MKVFISSATYNCAYKRTFNIISLALVFLFVFVQTYAQSNDQNFPTPISTNEIKSEIKARDIGDSRLTSHYYLFKGGRGDIFINVVSTNFNGDIDIFTAQGLRPKTKITLFADETSTETGRVIYMRKSENLILRIQGRTPNDDSAALVIKFAGSFEPIQNSASNEEIRAPEVKSSSQNGVRVNSVGTIIKPKSTPTPEVTEVVAENEADPIKNTDEVTNDKVEVGIVSSEEIKKEETISENKTEIVPEITEPKSVNSDIPSIFDPTKKIEDILKDAKIDDEPKLLITDPFKDKNSKSAEMPEKKENLVPIETNITLEIKEKSISDTTTVRIERVLSDEEESDKAEDSVNPLAKISLKVELKNGDKFERSMAEVLSMNVIKGVLTIVTNDGKIQEFSILDVVKMTIE